MPSLSEIKTVLRSILISSPVVFDVFQLNEEFNEQEGFGIPFNDFGHKSMIDFLKSIPDVLIIDGDSEYSEVTPVASRKSSHVNDLVLRQKTRSEPGKNLRNARTTNNKVTYVDPPAPQNQKQPEVISKVEADNEYTKQKSYSDKSINAKTLITSQKSFRSRCNKKSNRTENKYTNYKSSNGNLRGTQKKLNSTNKDIEGFSEYYYNKNIMNYETVIVNTNIRRRINHKNNSSNEETTFDKGDSFNVDISSTKYGKQADKIDRQGNSIKKTTKRNNTVQNGSGTKKLPQKMNKSNDKQINSGCHLMESDMKNKSKEIHNKKINETPHNKNDHIPRSVQDNLSNLISGYPEGIWCADLPLLYKNSTGEDLCFESYGYRCLKFLCLDLEDIFLCSYSKSDYKLFDVRMPLPEIDRLQEHINEEITQNSESIPAIPEMIWGSFDNFIPLDAVRLGYKPNRINVAEVLQADISINVVVTEIYDASKFWIIIDDSKFLKLIEDMQLYYGFYATQYLVPKSLLVETLYCAVLFEDKFYRAIILKVTPGDAKIKVFYVDFGTLGEVSKSEVWFLTAEFSELPTQAIRARLGDIYPPYEGATWCPLANNAFGSLTCMKKFIAEIISLDINENSVDIKLYDGQSDISNILVNRNLAKFINKPQQKHINDPNCKPSVHLLPTFEEIENWNHIYADETNEYEEIGENLVLEKAKL